MAIKVSDRFAKTCQVVYASSYDTCGTITRSSIDYLTPSTLESLFAPGGVWADLEAWFKTAFEMAACGTRVNGMYNWIMANADRTQMKSLLQTEKVEKNPAVVWPFVMANQESVINIEYWYISTGGAQSGYTAAVTGPLTAGDLALGVAGDRWLRIKSRYGVELDEKFFTPKAVLYVLGRSGIGVAERGQWKILASEVAADRLSVDVLVTSENSGSSQPYAAAPTSGIVLIGINNVNDFEKFCSNRANFDGRKRVPFWFQTRRRSRCIDQQYREWYARLTTSNVNEAFKQFGDIPLAERNRQDEEHDQREFVNSFFFQKPIGPNQTLANWKSLGDILTPTGFSVDPGTGAQYVSKRANWVGVVEQLRDCDRYRDLQGMVLNFYEWLDINYQLMRARKSMYGSCREIDWFCDNPYAANLITAFTEYLKKEFGSTNIQFPVDIQSPIAKDFGFTWRSFEVKFPAGLRINIVTHEFFDDLRDAYKTEGIESAGINLWALDWGQKGIFYSMLATNRKSWTVGDIKDLSRIDKDYACVMESFTKEITMTSETGAPVVRCPNNSLIITNIADRIPDTNGKSSVSGGSYSDLTSYNL